MRSVILIGTSHRYQCPGVPAADEFRDFIERVCAEFHVRAIAEEASLEALAQQHVSQSACEQIANALGIAHRYCDPNSEQRAALGITTDQDIKLAGFFNDLDEEKIEHEIGAAHAIRERYWMEQLFSLDCWPTLFVCGANHIKQFRKLLKENGLSVVIAARDWAPRR